MRHESNLTSKGQVTVPKDIRDALGLVAGQPVRFELDADGNARILKVDTLAERERRKADFLNRLKEAQVIFKDQAPWYTIAHSTQYVPMRANVTGFTMSPLGDFTFDRVDLTE